MPSATVSSLVLALARRDRGALLDILAADARIMHFGNRSPREWTEEQLRDQQAPFRIINTESVGLDTRLIVFRFGNTARNSESRATYETWHIEESDGRVVGLEIAPIPPVPMPRPVTTFVDATNGGDLEALLSAFSDTATANDELVEYRGRAQIRAWLERDIVGASLTLYVTRVERNNGQVAVWAQVEGAFDRRGLPEPLIVTFYFSLRADRIVQLIILRNLPAI